MFIRVFDPDKELYDLLEADEINEDFYQRRIPKTTNTE